MQLYMHSSVSMESAHITYSCTTWTAVFRVQKYYELCVIYSRYCVKRAFVLRTVAMAGKKYGRQIYVITHIRAITPGREGGGGGGTSVPRRYETHHQHHHWR